MRNLRLVFVTVGVVAMWLPISSPASSSQLQVLSSTEPGIRKNAVFPDNKTFDVPAGKVVKFLKKPENTTHEIVGPYKGLLEDYAPLCGFWAWFKGQCYRNSDPVGGSRSVAKKMQPPPPSE